MNIKFYWQDYKYLPYEKKLARIELAKLFSNMPQSSTDFESIKCSNNWEKLAYRTTYFREASSSDGKSIIPLQAFLEYSANGENKFPMKTLSGGVYPFLHRQSTRYSAHGLHEYRGKYNPQIVRVIGNILKIKEDEWLFDPFCGSGTTLLESVHNGWNAFGIDMNPLAVEITRAKIAAMHIDLNDLLEASKSLSNSLIKASQGLSYTTTWSNNDIKKFSLSESETNLSSKDYLKSWFTPSVLAQLFCIYKEINQLKSTELMLIFRIILSDILREVSLQDPADLRIRRRKSPAENYPVIPIFIKTMDNKIETIIRARNYLNPINTKQEVLLGDSRNIVSQIKLHPLLGNDFKFKAAITSPPYATALPYIDTQRLSLVFLGLMSPQNVRKVEQDLIGTRELSNKQRNDFENKLESNIDNLPFECITMCKKLLYAVNKETDGFRRQNVPVLVYKYLIDMMCVFDQMSQLQDSGSPFALIVGQNKTTLGGQPFIINTPNLLVDIAESNNYILNEIIDLNTYQRFDVHKDNSIKSESLIILKRS